MDILQAHYASERARLNVIADGAGLYASPVMGEGSLKPCLLLIGEAPGGEEAKLGRPFVGKAGKQLDELLALSSIDRADVYITNAVKYRPVTHTRTGMRNRTPKLNEVKAGLPLLLQEIRCLRPLIIATLGNTPLRAVHMLSGGAKGTVGELHGRELYVSVEGQALRLFPLYHPASVIYNRSLIDVLETDLRALGKLVNNR